MGVVYHANARFLRDDRTRITLPAPIDPDTPHAPWWYDWIAAHARELRRAGFTAILYPPVSKAEGGHWPTADGYGVFDHYDIGSKDQCGSLETRFGTREQLQRSIAVARACDLDVYLDVVMHQLSGGANGVYEFRGANGRAKAGRFPKHPGCFRGAPPRRPEDPVPAPADDFPFGDEFVYVNCDPPGYTTTGMLAFGDWLTRSLGVQGYRVDDTKGLAVAFVSRWMQSRAMANNYCVSEYFDGNPETLHWWTHGSGMNGRSAVFDFTLHWALQKMCDDPGFDMRRLNGTGYAARAPYHAVTFVDNPDTDLSPGQNIISNKLLAYAYILTTEGYPLVYHKDYAQEPGCYGLKPWIDNLVWIHERLAIGATTTRWNDDKTIVLERLGPPGLLTAISSDVWSARRVTCATAFGPHTRLHDYTGHHDDIWTDDRGNASFTIPSNAFGRAHSYLCFSRDGQGAAIEVRALATQQTFFGADDLDIAPAPLAGHAPVGRIWCAADKPLELEVHALVANPAQASLAVRVIGPDGHAVVAASRGGAHGHGPIRATTQAHGWHTIEIAADGFPAAVPYELTITYVAPQTL